MKKISVNIRDYFSDIQYEVYWKDVEKGMKSDIYEWECGFFRNMFVIFPIIDKLQTEKFVEYLADSSVIKTDLGRTVEQSGVCSSFEYISDDWRRREFFSEPLKKAHFYNEFKGVHAIDLSEWVDNDISLQSKDLQMLMHYIRGNIETRFLLWAKAEGDPKCLVNSFPGISFRKLQLPYPRMNPAYRLFCQNSVTCLFQLADQGNLLVQAYVRYFTDKTFQHPQ